MVDAPLHVLDLGKALAAEPVGDLQAATAVVAVDDDAAVAVRLQFRDADRNVSHRNVPRGLDVNEVVFVLLATVEQQKIFAGIQQRFYGEHVDFQRNWGGGGHVVLFGERRGGGSCHGVNGSSVCIERSILSTAGVAKTAARGDRRFRYNARSPFAKGNAVAATIDSAEARQFAIEVVERLRAAGYDALWAGGCVRDQLLGHEPKDYDVATSAPPDAIRDLFGRRRTLAIGAAFGVITVLGKRGAGQIEVATFRRDAEYSDGRHPDRVAFSTAEEDAQRRDFTINGLFFDPLAERVIDFVGGQEDLKNGVVRAIRDPRERFAEDKLRMLRAVRFAATFGFTLEAGTLAAIQQFAAEIIIVSAERIAAEMRRMLTHPSRRRALELLHESGLLPIILPEAAAFHPEFPPDEISLAPDWQRTLRIVEHLEQPTFPTALAAFVRELVEPLAAGHRAETICQRWRLSNAESETVMRLIAHEASIRRARELPWPQLLRELDSNFVAELLTYGAAVAQVVDATTAEIDFCRVKLRLPRHELDPPPLLTGDHLKAVGIPPGPGFRGLLEAVRDAQLESRIRSQAEAIALVQQMWRTTGDAAH